MSDYKPLLKQLGKPICDVCTNNLVGNRESEFECEKCKNRFITVILSGNVIADMSFCDHCAEQLKRCVYCGYLLPSQDFSELIKECWDEIQTDDLLNAFFEGVNWEDYRDGKSFPNPCWIDAISQYLPLKYNKGTIPEGFLKSREELIQSFIDLAKEYLILKPTQDYKVTPGTFVPYSSFQSWSQGKRIPKFDELIFFYHGLVKEAVKDALKDQH